MDGREGRRIRTQIARTVTIAAAVIALAVLPGGAAAQTVEELRRLSVDDLANLEITSVSRRPEKLNQAPAAIYVITDEEILRSGVVSLPEALRLAPNLEVARVGARDYVISARGFNSVNASNKLLVLIDGRSVYTPFFSSVFWDQQELVLADIDRIEVISGPGGTLYGANAVNGVINIITKSSAATQGGLLDARYGTFDKRGAARWGGKLGDVGTYRVQALGFARGNTTFPGGASARDDFTGKQAGFRTDFALSDSRFTVQGDAYENIIETPHGRLTGGNLLGRWTKPLGQDSSMEVQGYYDRQERLPAGQIFLTETFDLQGQYNFPVGAAHRFVVGLGQRAFRDRFTNMTGPFILVPEIETLFLTNVFAQDTIALRDDLALTIGAKFEYNTLSGFEYLPSIRLGWQATESDFLWAAISRVVRTPSRLDRELQALPLFAPATNFRSEKLIAYEAGYRTRPSSNTSLSVSLFYNEYDDLRTTSLTEGGLPITFRNALGGHAFGLEAWGEFRPVQWWRLTAGLTLLRKHISLDEGGTDIAGIQTSAGFDPEHQAFLRSYMALWRDTDLFVGLRHVGGLSGAGVGSYFEADARIAWRVTPEIEVSVTGQNLVHPRHIETFTTDATRLQIPRSVYAGVRFEF